MKIRYLWALEPENFAYYCEDFLKIQPKEGPLQSLVFNPTQVRLDREFVKLKREGKPPRVLLLKARQQGFSTWSEAYCYKEVTSHYDYRGAVIAHEKRTAIKLYKMFKLYHELFPDELKPFKRAPGNSYGLYFDKLRSSIDVLSAESTLGSSGGTYQFVHISELSKWRQAEEAMLSLMQTIPMSATVIIESTAYGMGNYYHQLWTEAKDGNNEYTPMFFPWQEHPEYVRPLRKGEVLEPDLDERYYYERFNLSQEQLKWMRWSRKNNCGGDWDSFRQEYPAYEDEAFITSGRPVFDMRCLQNKELELVKNPPESMTGNIILHEDAKECSAEFVPDEYGDVEIYDLPEKGDKTAYRYVFGLDVSEGLQKGSRSDRKLAGDTDFNVMIGWDKLKAQQILFVRNKLDPDQLGTLAFALMIFYGGAIDKSYYPMLVIERNGPGITTIMYARDLCFKYGIPINRLYHRGELDKDFEPSTDLIGFRTLEDTKRVLIGEMQRRIREAQDGIKSLITIRESMTYVRDERGKMNAQSGKWDDAVIAQALAYEGIRRDQLPYEIKEPVIITGWRAKLAKDARRRNRKTSSYWGRKVS